MATCSECGIGNVAVHPNHKGQWCPRCGVAQPEPEAAPVTKAVKPKAKPAKKATPKSGVVSRAIKAVRKR